MGDLFGQTCNVLLQIFSLIVNSECFTARKVNALLLDVLSRCLCAVSNRLMKKGGNTLR